MAKVNKGNRPGQDSGPVPLPPQATYTGQAQRSLPSTARPPSGDIPSPCPDVQVNWAPDPDAAIVGVIDTAIRDDLSVFHRIDGGSRFLFSWDQDGAWQAGQAVPYGREWTQTQIDRRIWRDRSCERLRKAGNAGNLRQATAYVGQRRNVPSDATCAIGFELNDSRLDEARRRLPLIGVSLPNRSGPNGESGHEDAFVLDALSYILDRANQIWHACGYDPAGGFPIIVHFADTLRIGPLLLEKISRMVPKQRLMAGQPLRILRPDMAHLRWRDTGAWRAANPSSDPIGEDRATPKAVLPGHVGVARYDSRSLVSDPTDPALPKSQPDSAVRTRMVALAMLDWIDDGSRGNAPGTEKWLRDELLLDCSYPSSLDRKGYQTYGAWAHMHYRSRRRM